MARTLKETFPYALLMALLLLGVFMLRSLYQPFYVLTARYALAIAGVAVLVLACYCRSLKPLRARGEGGLDWYVGRAWLMGAMGTLLAVLLVYGYAYQVDEDYFPRRLAWERAALETNAMPEEIVDLFMEDEYKVKPFHWEEITLAFLSAGAVGPGAVLVCLFFIGYNKRDATRAIPG